MEKVALTTLGCKVNQYETEAMTELFRNKGYKIVDFDDFADVYVVNTCTVTSFGDKKSRQMIRKAKRINNNAIIAVTGCYSQVSPDKVMEIPGVNIVLGTADRSGIVEYIEDFKKDRATIKHVGNIMNVGKFEELDIDEYRDKTRAFLKIQDGCNRFCSYCIIPYARGPVRSRDPENIIMQVEKLSNSGFKEVILSGIHVASYGTDIGGINLVDVLEKIQDVPRIERIRIGSLEPTFFTCDVIARLKNIQKLCRHFHISLQSGCDETLKRMNRHYTTSQYRDIVNDLRCSFPDVSITTDIISGFPGENEEEFQKTYDYLKSLKLSKTHIFKYSVREGTRAANFNNQVAPEEKDRRSEMLLKLSAQNERIFIEKFMGKTEKVLFEQYVSNLGGVIEGYTGNYINVRVQQGESSMLGRIYECVLYENDGAFAIGRIVER